MKPQFFILTGPNRAGRSTYGHEHAPKGIHIFNGDMNMPNCCKSTRFKLKGGVPPCLKKERDRDILVKSVKKLAYSKR